MIARQYVTWKNATLSLLIVCFLLIGVLQLPSPGSSTAFQIPTSSSSSSPLSSRLTVADSSRDPSGDTVARQLFDNERERVKRLEAALEHSRTMLSQAHTTASTTSVKATTTVESEPIKSLHTFIPSNLNPQCQDSDIITLQRWIHARQHWYEESDTPSMTSDSPSPSPPTTRNPDPDPHCTNTKLMIDTVPSYYIWSEADLLQEMSDELNRVTKPSPNGGSQRIIFPSHLPFGRRARRQTGFGIGAQLHIMATRMIWAWKNGYTYVNLARSTWTKGMKRQTGEEADPIPFQSDPQYWHNSPWSSAPSSSDSTDLDLDSCSTGGLDCFFRPIASFGCYQRARRIWREAMQYPQLSEENRQKVRTIETKWNALIDHDLEDELKKSTFTYIDRMKAIIERSQDATIDHANSNPSPTSLSTPRIEFDFTVNPDANDWLQHSANPWKLPGFNLRMPSTNSRGDLFLISETLRFIMRPNKWMKQSLRQLLLQINYPGFRSNSADSPSTPAASASDHLPRAVVSMHVRRNVDQRSQNLIPIHKSDEFTVMAKRLTSVLGTTSVFISSDDKSKLDRFSHELGSGTKLDAGFGLQVLHIPTSMIGDAPPPIKPVPHGKMAATWRTSGPGSMEQARDIVERLADGEGAMHVATLFIMGVLSSGFIGTLSSHWGRIVMELQRWDEGNCSPPKSGWIVPPIPSVSSFSSSASLDHPPASSKTSSFQPIFVDLDGDTYFVGDFKVVRHPRIPQPNSPYLDPTIDE